MMRLFHHLSTDHTAQEVIQAEIRAHLRRSGSPSYPLLCRSAILLRRHGWELAVRSMKRFSGQMLGDVEDPTAPFGLMDVQGDGSGIGRSACRVGQ